MDIMTHYSPPDWKLYRLGQVFHERKEKGSDKEFPPLSVTMKGIVPQLDTAAKSDDSDNRKIVHIGDYAINSRSDRKGSGGISKYEGSVSLITIVLEPQGIDTRFAHHLLRSPAFQEEFYRWGHGIVADLWTTRYADMKNIRLKLPDLTTQRQIADFLDRETARIGLLIEKKQRLVELLGEKYFATLGNLTFPKDGSSNDELIPFRWVCRIAEGQVDPTSESWKTKALIAPNHIESKTGRLLKIESAEEQGAISGKYSFKKGTVIYSKIRPALAKAVIAPQAGMCSADMYPIRPDKRLLSDFLLMQLLSARFTDWATLESMRVAMPKINRETLGGFKLRVPLISEQKVAIQQFYINKKKFQITTDKINESVKRLKEYRSALITAAVTGQIDVTAYANSGTTDRQLDAIQEEMGA